MPTRIFKIFISSCGKPYSIHPLISLRTVGTYLRTIIYLFIYFLLSYRKLIVNISSSCTDLDESSASLVVPLCAPGDAVVVNVVTHRSIFQKVTVATAAATVATASCSAGRQRARVVLRGHTFTRPSTDDT